VLIDVYYNNQVNFFNLCEVDFGTGSLPLIYLYEKETLKQIAENVI
jgi:hypothetical protein